MMIYLTVLAPLQEERTRNPHYAITHMQWTPPPLSRTGQSGNDRGWAPLASISRTSFADTSPARLRLSVSIQSSNMAPRIETTLHRLHRFGSADTACGSRHWAGAKDRAKPHEMRIIHGCAKTFTMSHLFPFLFQIFFLVSYSHKTPSRNTFNYRKRFVLVPPI